jgi:putative peptidoglycan lipid II flippase
VLLAAAVAGIVLTTRHQPTPAAAAASVLVPLRGSGSYDPKGDGQEHTPAAPKATDGNPQTFWSTDQYYANGFTKPGVGLVLDAGSPVKLARLALTTDTPGYEAQIQTSDSPSGGFAPDSGWQTVGTTTTFNLQGRTGRYWMVWLRLPTHTGVAHVNEVKAYR